MKKVISVILIVGLILTLSTSVFAKSNHNSSDLTDKERAVLLNESGLIEEELALYPVTFLRELIANNAKRLSAPKFVSYDLKSEDGQISGFGTMALTTDDITLNGGAWELTSDIPNRKKFVLAGNFYWQVKPVWNLTDKMSIGYPVTNEWYLNTSGGQVLGHSSETCNYIGFWSCVTKTVPSDHDLGVGVAAAFDLIGTASGRKGFVQQVVYTQKATGSSNVLFRYGHKTATGSVGVGIYPAGLAVTPAITTETLDYVTTFSW